MLGDWILVGNESDHAVDVNIDIGGNLMQADGSTTFRVDSHSSIFPMFDGLAQGPIEVRCLTCLPDEELIISQRVIYMNSLNEVVGKP